MTARDVEIVDLWNGGLNAPEIAGRLGATRYAIESKIGKLRRAGVVLDSRQQRRPKPATTTRRCLYCGDDFASEHVGNRLCPTCLDTTGLLAGAII